MLGKKKASAGAPEWVLTYGDMMSLLLCFFILLAAFADYEDGAGSPQMIAAMQSIQQALGMSGQTGNLIDPSIDFNALALKLQTLVTTLKTQHQGDSPEKGIYGESFRLRRIRDGMEITLGGPILFEPFSAQITADGQDALEQIADNLKGHRNKLEIRGHAAEQPRPADWTPDDAWKLSYDRAQRVADELIARGVDPRTIRLSACGANEPVSQKSYDPNTRGDNRRVEIIIRESMIDDYVGQEPAAGPAATQPADAVPSPSLP